MTLDPILVRRVQRAVGADDDGKFGPDTLLAVAVKLGVDVSPPSDVGWPADNETAIRAFFGPPGEDNLVSFEFPYPMRLYVRGGPVITSHRCHRKVRASLLSVLTEIQRTYGMEWIEHHGLHIYAGIYNYRRMTGGGGLSRHSWGIAIDLNPADNAFSTPWRADRIGHAGYATMPIEAIEVFERHGWKSGARAWGQDAMHFQATS